MTTRPSKAAPGPLPAGLPAPGTSTPPDERGNVWEVVRYAPHRGYALVRQIRADGTRTLVAVPSDRLAAVFGT